MEKQDVGAIPTTVLVEAMVRYMEAYALAYSEPLRAENERLRAIIEESPTSVQLRLGQLRQQLQHSEERVKALARMLKERGMHTIRCRAVAMPDRGSILFVGWKDSDEKLCDCGLAAAVRKGKP